MTPRKKTPARRKAKIDFGRYVDKARTALHRKIQRAIDEFGLGSYQGFTIDQQRGVMEFTAGGKVRVRARAVIAGSIGLHTGTWLWSWANDSILPTMSEPLKQVARFGEEHGFEPLTHASWEAEEADGWSMAAVATEVLQLECAYRVPNKNGFTFVLLDGLEKIPEPPTTSRPRSRPRGAARG